MINRKVCIDFLRTLAENNYYGSGNSVSLAIRVSALDLLFRMGELEDENKTAEEIAIKAVKKTKCLVCGKDIVLWPTNNSNKKYCSDACRCKAYRTRKNPNPNKPGRPTKETK